MKDQKKMQPKNPDVHDPSKVPHKTPRKAVIENPDQRENPNKKITIDDDPDQTKKKIPVEEKPTGEV